MFLLSGWSEPTLTLRQNVQPRNLLVAQLPADEAPGDACMLHYTWGTVFKDAAGAKVWEFDKRVYTDEKLQRIVRPPSLSRWRVRRV